VRVGIAGAPALACTLHLSDPPRGAAAASARCWR
jgi:hypothetical protein